MVIVSTPDSRIALASPSLRDKKLYRAERKDVKTAEQGQQQECVKVGGNQASSAYN